MLTGPTVGARQVLVRDQNAHHVLNHAAAGFLGAIPALTEGHGVDVSIECAADVNLQRDLGIVAQNGRVVDAGNRAETHVNPSAAMARDAVITPFLLANASADDLANTYGALAALFKGGTLRPTVGSELPLDQAARAHRDVLQSKAQGKIGLTPSCAANSLPVCPLRRYRSTRPFHTVGVVLIALYLMGRWRASWQKNRGTLRWRWSRRFAWTQTPCCVLEDLQRTGEYGLRRISEQPVGLCNAHEQRTPGCIGELFDVQGAQ